MRKAYVQINNDFHMVVDVAVSGEEIARGLSDRSYLMEQEGMLFICHHPVPFWMKNMKIPIDILWLDNNHLVVDIISNAQPCPDIGECPSHMPETEFSYVLETIPGFAYWHNVTVGTQIPFQISPV